jgi:hypothetical protein
MSTPNLAIVQEPSVRAFQDWTPLLIRSAELLADSGTLLQAADLCDQMMADDRLLAVINKRIHGVLGLDLTFEASRGKRRPVKALDVGEDWWAMFAEEELGEVLKWGTLLGIGVGRMTWVTKGDRVVGVLDAWHPRNLRWNWQTRTWEARIDGGTWVPIAPGDGNWILYTPYGRKRPWAKGLWRGLARWWLLKQYAITDWGQYSEGHGQTTRVATSTAAANPGKNDRKELAADMKAMARGATLAMPPGWDFKVVSDIANTWMTFKAQNDGANAAFAITVLGNNLSTEVTGGSFAAADVHKVAEASVLRFTAETASTCTHEQALTWWAEFNYGSRDLAPWPQWAIDPPEDLKALADLWVAGGTALAQFAAFKLPIDLAEFCATFKVPLLAGAAIPLLEAPPPPPNPFGGPGDGGNGGNGGGDNADGGGDQGGGGKAARGRRAKAAAPKRTGLKAGQTYADNLADTARERAVTAIAPDLKAILKAVEDGEDFGDIRDRLAKAYQAMSPAKLAKVVTATMTMGELAGRTALAQDT